MTDHTCREAVEDLWWCAVRTYRPVTYVALAYYGIGFAIAVLRYWPIGRAPHPTGSDNR